MYFSLIVFTMIGHVLFFNLSGLISSFMGHLYIYAKFLFSISPVLYIWQEKFSSIMCLMSICIVTLYPNFPVNFSCAIVRFINKAASFSN